MKGRDWKRLARREILPVLGEEYSVKGSLVYRRPIEHVLFGVNAVTMYEASRLTFKAVAMPLYQPFDALASLIPGDLGAAHVLDLEPDPQLEWEHEIQRRCRLVLSLMDESPKRTLAQLVEWEDKTLGALRLSRD